MPLTILYDGDCALCNWLVVFILKRDTGKVFQFQSLQSDFGQLVLEKYNLPKENFETVMLLKGEHVLEKSTAVLEITKLLGYPWKLLYAFKIIPVVIRDAVYQFVAKNRHRWFKKSVSCELPKAEWKGRY